jgi:hypothetical protein
MQQAEYEDSPMYLDLLEAAHLEQWPTSRLIRAFEQAVIRKRMGGPRERWNNIKLRVASTLAERYDPQEAERLLGLDD